MLYQIQIHERDERYFTDCPQNAHRFITSHRARHPALNVELWRQTIHGQWRKMEG